MKKKLRVYELAKRLKISSKKLLEVLEDLDIEVKNHMSSLDLETARLVKDLIIEDKEAEDTEKDEDTKIITLSDKISVKELGAKMDVDPIKIIKKLMDFGLMVNINAEIDFESAKKLGQEFGFDIKKKEKDFIKSPQTIEDDEEDLRPRPPVITVMGHVDHGKTSLLDAIRKTEVTSSEAGGITQHIGASEVDVNGKKLVFLDTPGHEAFTAMRARGATVTDIAILVVAADDGVMPQTVEAINHAKAAGVPIIVAVNKIDKPEANPERIKQQLSEYNLIPEDWGGDTIFVNVSARSGEGIDNLLEMLLLVAELEELKANPKANATGVIIEAELDKGRGPVATVIIQRGTLKIGDGIVAGTAFGRVRALFDYRGNRIKSAGPSKPVEVLGLSEVPSAGEILKSSKDEKVAKAIADKNKQIQREEAFSTPQRITLDKLYDKVKEGEVKDLNLIIKADVHGTIEALKQTLEECSTEEVQVKIIHGGVGAVSESDVMLASASNAIIIGFNVRPDSKAKKLAENEHIDIRTYRVIYDVVDDIKAAMKGMLEPEFKEVVLGRAEVRALFKVPNVGTVAGCLVTDGKITRKSKIRIIRQGKIIHEENIDSLKRFKDDVREVPSGYECGISLENFNDIKEHDIFEAYIKKEIER